MKKLVFLSVAILCNYAGVYASESKLPSEINILESNLYIPAKVGQILAPIVIAVAAHDQVVPSRPGNKLDNAFKICTACWASMASWGAATGDSEVFYGSAKCAAASIVIHAGVRFLKPHAPQAPSTAKSSSRAKSSSSSPA